MNSPVEEALRGQPSVVTLAGSKATGRDIDADNVLTQYAKAFGAGKDVIVINESGEVFQAFSPHEILGILIQGDIKVVFSVPRELWETLGPKLHHEQGVHVFASSPTNW